MKNITRNRVFSTLLCMVFLYGTHTLAQAQSTPLINASIAGKVIDSLTRSPIAGATVRLEAVTHQVQTDELGNFKLVTGQKLPATVIVTVVGYTKRTVVIRSSPTVIVLSQNQDFLDEVVVVGYAQKRRSSETGAITEVKGKALEYQGGVSLSEKIQGLAPGLQIASASGVEGGSALVRLRGATSINANNDPLYIIDGVFINSRSLQNVNAGGQNINPLADINPADIESIEIFKDANATAMYGSRGANGVIIVTTKRGKRNAATRININSVIGKAVTPKVWNLVTGPEHASILNQQWVNDGKSYESRPYRPASEGGAGNPEDQGTYDRLSLIFRDPVQTTHNLSIAGGGEKTSFFLSGEFTKQPSILKLQDFNRLSFRTNLDHQISSAFSIGTSIAYSSTERETVPTGDTGGITNTGLHTPTLTPLFNSDGTFNRGERFNNPYVLLENSNSHAYGKHLIGNVFAKWNILKNLSFKSSFSLDDNSYNEVIYYNANLNQGLATNGSGRDVLSTETTWVAEQLLNYIPLSNQEHFLSIFLGNTLQRGFISRASLTGTNYPSTQFTTISSAAVTTASATGRLYNGLISYFGGVNYTFRDRYSLDANVRTDASSRFGANNRWATFPSIGAAWNIAKESFVRQNLEFVNTLQLKGSIGWTGNQGIPDFSSQLLWTGGNNYLDKPGVAPTQLGNENLKWETTRQWNVGLETSLLNRRLSLNIDLYNKYTRDLLLEVPTPAKTGFSSSYQNFGEISNKGFEIELKTLNITNDNFQWNTTFNISHNKNKVEKLSKSFTQYNRDWVRIEEGYPLYSFWLYKQLYVDSQTGNAVYDDSRTGDGKITVDDRQIVGNAWPSIYGSLTNQLSYKNFSFAFNLYFSQGNKVFNMNRYFQEHAGSRGTSWSMLSSMLRSWQEPGDVTDIPRITTLQNADGSYNHNYESSRFLEDASFIRLKYINIGYTFPTALLGKQHVIKKLGLYFNATNLLTFTGYSGPDPEVNVAQSQAGATVQGLDFSMPPHARVYQFGVNLTL
ncbi:SusC/RagA family TonB-linked outer membrane protein [Sphingobacterium sp. SYP-B4668]|uniref:SusC/RagA family TonB-linked outer membrane protein n=1 Tax=Sphingobacterium sp. SYP-B4668 TaxID=2996035 RepID=UPI0022DE1F25|nr:TonB-dependent receptor [Sphingobacterium sp. SYP-B4668]